MTPYGYHCPVILMSDPKRRDKVTKLERVLFWAIIAWLGLSFVDLVANHL